jgi:hypothetical protein
MRSVILIFWNGRGGGDLLFHGSRVNNDGLTFSGRSKLEGCYLSEISYYEVIHTLVGNIYTNILYILLLESPWQKQHSTRRSFFSPAKGSQITVLDRP